MSAPAVEQAQSPTVSSALAGAIETATRSIAPSWPLDRLIAVNPYWGQVQEPFQKAAYTQARLAGSSMTMSLAYYRDAWTRNEITPEDLEKAISESHVDATSTQLIRALDDEPPWPKPLPLLSDQIDGRRDLHTHPSWFDTIKHEISQFCAAYFDRQQADWHPERSASLFASWRQTISQDHGIRLLMGAPDVAPRARRLADTPVAQISASLAGLGVPEDEWARFLHSVILRIGGWASWCAYLRWQEQLHGRDDDTLVDLLAIRLSWETLLDDGERGPGTVWAAWNSDWRNHNQRQDDFSLRTHLIWQRAQEISYQRGLIASLTSAVPQPVAASPDVQAAFCIDVRSEVFRRHFEAQSARLETLGFAGFFGLPISYAPLGTHGARPQLPGLLAPSLHITDSSGDSDQDASIASERVERLSARIDWQTFQATPLSTFSLVETLGLGYLTKLVRRSLPGSGERVSEASTGLSNRQAQRIKPTLDVSAAGGREGRAGIAAKVLDSMGFGNRFARLVLLIGHGSQTTNNPHQAGLDCGACSGQTGEVNARALAGLLNCSDVRKDLYQHNIQIPDDTLFIAGLHNTTTDDVRLFDLDALPVSHEPDIKRVRQQLEAAGSSGRAERALILRIEKPDHDPASLHRQMKKRADDWAQTRPEWGLANNAAFIVAPRSTTRAINLGGRAFLHDYDYHQDSDGSLLEQIMTAPMLVTNWINMQYFASTVDNKRYGSGNKTLHNVVGGRIGVFEGNGGDLRIGLPWQSLHDGQQWRHTPLRLTVVIEAPAESITAVIERHEIVRQLVENQWLYLMRLEDGLMEVYRDGQWHSLQD